MTDFIFDRDSLDEGANWLDARLEGCRALLGEARSDHIECRKNEAFTKDVLVCISTETPSSPIEVRSKPGRRPVSPLVGYGVGLTLCGLESVVGAGTALSVSKLIGSRVPIGTNLLKGAVAGGLMGGLDYGINKALSGGDKNSWYALKATNNHAQSTIFQPSGLEMVFTGAVAALPIDTRVKLGLIGASWLAGRAENYFELKVIKGR